MTVASDVIERARAVPIESEIARRGGLKLKRRGKELIGPCPVCGGDDRFGANITAQVFNCRRCGAKGNVIALVQHIDGCDFVTACSTLAGERPAKSNVIDLAKRPAKSNGMDNGTGHSSNGKDEQATVEPRKVRVAEYKYPDESGALLFASMRVEFQNADGSYVLKDGKRKKTFRQRRPDPEQPGKWIWNVNGVRIVPYRLPELLENSSAPVCIFEGEAKVDVAREWGLVATCNAGGAGKWTAEHAEFLRGREVAVIPDNDKPGADHAEMVARSLVGIAKEIHIVELPGLGPKEDILDRARKHRQYVPSAGRAIQAMGAAPGGAAGR
jgi:hypothetical protein